MSDKPLEQSIFLAALELATPAERDAYLSGACGNNEAFRAAVAELLAAHERAGNILDAPPVAAGGTVAQDNPGAGYLEHPGTVIGPYKLIEPIGEGGMGSVWMAQQTEPVKRLVAIKLVKAGMDSRQVIARFEAERQALALMDHPNIAKVLDGGTTGAGRPYFVMDLVKGVPITRYCDEHRLTPRQRLELFIPVCQAVQHAHQKGIIHRDLKPSNVLVALYDGKPVPKVIDFGVAKAAGQTLTEKTLVTGFGNIVGTPEYMSPEQAEINQLDIDTRSDIYSLGVLLYELLTGSPPFTRKELEKAGMLEMLRVIREQEPSKPSNKLSTSEGLPTLAANRGTEPARLAKLVRGELDWIVMKTLEKDRNRRYETANGFAADVQHYLSDEPVQACPPSASYRFRKFARRNKAGLGVACMILCFLLLFGSGAGWVVRDRAAREEEQERDRTARLTKVAGQAKLILTEVERLEIEQKWPDALAAARRAQAVIDGGETGQDTCDRVRQVLADLELVARLEEIRLREGELYVGAGFDHAAAAQLYAAAFRDYGVDLARRSADEAAARLRSRPVIAGCLAAGLDHWAGNSDWEGAEDLWKLAARIDPDPWRLQLRQAVVAGDIPALLALAKAPDTARQSAQSQLLLANELQRDFKPQAIALLERASEAYPADFWIHYQLGRWNHDLKRLEAEVRHYTAARALRPQNSGIWVNHGFALSAQGKLDDAIACYHKAIELDSKNWMAYANLGGELGNQGKLDEAIACHRKAIALAPKSDAVVAVLNTYVAAVLNTNLAGDLAKQGQLDEAIACFHKAIEIDPRYAKAHDQLGAALAMQGKWREASTCFRKAIELDPKDAAAYSNLGAALAKLKKPDEAIACCRKAIELDPNLALAHTNLGNALNEQGQLDEAIVRHRKAIELDPKYAKAHDGLGAALAMQGRWRDASTCFRKAIELDPKDAAAYSNLGAALVKLKKANEAIASFKKAIEIDPKEANAHNNLGYALKEQKKLDEAIACYRKAIELDPNHADAHNNLGNALQEEKKLDEAIACYRKAIELRPTFAMAHTNLGNALQGQKKLDEAITCYRKAIEIEPTFAMAHNNLGYALKGQKKLNEAIACYRKAIELDPTFAMAHKNLGYALKEQKQMNEAIACYRKAIELDPNYANAHNDLAWLLASCADPKVRDAKRAVDHAKKAVDLKPGAGTLWNTLGVAQYRAGDWNAAIAALAKSNDLLKGNHLSFNGFFLAMAQWQLGNKDEARKWYDQAVEWMEKNKPEDEELRRFRAEAESLLRIEKKSKPR
jgi:tetratricopeptide (TPR) repeat protein/serine/threonine protein kinase